MDELLHTALSVICEEPFFIFFGRGKARVLVEERHLTTAGKTLTDCDYQQAQRQGLPSSLQRRAQLSKFGRPLSRLCHVLFRVRRACSLRSRL
jgi:hypothetical protein